jgi:hypothetical protein
MEPPWVGINEDSAGPSAAHQAINRLIVAAA